MRTQTRRLTTDELARIEALSLPLWEADCFNKSVRFVYTKDDGSVSEREGTTAGVFGQESKASVFLLDDLGAGKTFNLRNITDLRVL
jgi:hypothetical protein